jgi:hypothetical protein
MGTVQSSGIHQVWLADPQRIPNRYGDGRSTADGMVRCSSFKPE